MPWDTGIYVPAVTCTGRTCVSHHTGPGVPHPIYDLGMPTPPPRLRPWLDALGTGGTLAQAERLAQLADQLATAPRTTITLTPETEIKPGHVYALSFPDDVYTAIDEITPLIDDLSNLTGALFITFIRGATPAEVTGPDSALVAQLIADRVAARAESTRLRAVLQRLASAEDTARDALIEGPGPGEPAAALDLAAMLTKEVRAAVRRAIDIARTQPPRFQFQDAPGGPLPAIPDDAYPPGSTPLPPPVGWDDPTGREAAATVALDHDPQAETFTIPDAPDTGQIHDLIETSSLGSPQAAAARASIPLEQGEAAVRRAVELAQTGPATDGDAAPARSRSRARRLAELTDNPSAQAAPSNAEIRAWCANQGVPVSTRGAIPKAARHAYNTAHGKA